MVATWLSLRRGPLLRPRRLLEALQAERSGLFVRTTDIELSVRTTDMELSVDME